MFPVNGWQEVDEVLAIELGANRHGDVVHCLLRNSQIANGIKLRMLGKTLDTCLLDSKETIDWVLKVPWHSELEVDYNRHIGNRVSASLWHLVTQGGYRARVSEVTANVAPERGLMRPIEGYPLQQIQKYCNAVCSTLL